MADADPTRTPAPASPAPSPADDWPSQAADTIVRVVGNVRDRTTGAAVTAGRAVVYGLLAGLLGLTALIVLCVLLVRGTVVLVDLLLGLGDLDRAGRANWITQLLYAAAFAFGGLVLWRRATSSAD